jgi:S1-C subfamily serine protease
VEDTVLVYQDGLKAAKNAPLKSVSILNKVEYLVFDAPKLSSFSVLSRNKADDLALIKTELPDERTEPFTVETLKMNLGNEKWMQWGSLVYALGYPMGYKMLTKGLISDPDKESNFYTLSDIQFNPGISGGLVMSIRGDTHAFEWIGMASSASSTVEYVLRPRENALNEKEDFQVYTDTLFVQRKVAVNQGITRSIKASSIRRFLDESASILSANGFDLTTFYSLANNPK